MLCSSALAPLLGKVLQIPLVLQILIPPEGPGSPTAGTPLSPAPWPLPFSAWKSLALTFFFLHETSFAECGKVIAK